MNRGIELFKDIKDNPKTERFDGAHFMLYEPVSDINEEYSVSNYCISTPPVSSMTIDDYIERLK